MRLKDLIIIFVTDGFGHSTPQGATKAKINGRRRRPAQTGRRRPAQTGRRRPTQMGRRRPTQTERTSKTLLSNVIFKIQYLGI